MRVSPYRHRTEHSQRRVLVLGGYGTFGQRICERASKMGFPIIVAGRSRSKAEKFCAHRKGFEPMEIDRSHRDLDKLFRKIGAFAVVDAVGPFQRSGYEVARAAISAGSHYIDIADSTTFVCGINALDKEAKASNVCVISGASSVPALSGAVASHLANGLRRVHGVDITISASSRGTGGRSVAEAILSYIGRPVRVCRGGRWTVAHGWQELQRTTYKVDHEPKLENRLVAFADVPDLCLLPTRLPGHPAVSFHAGTDAPWHNLGLWLLSWAVRARLLDKPEKYTDALTLLQSWTRGPSSDRSAFEMRMYGMLENERIERRFTLIANNAEGPEIPSLAVPLLLEKLADGAMKVGATDAGKLLSLEEFQPSIRALATVQQIAERTLGAPLYQRVVGDESFNMLPPMVRQMHTLLRDGGASGEVVVQRGRNPLAKIIARMMGFPPAGAHSLHVSFSEHDGREKWTREFSNKYVFSSELYKHNDTLIESFLGLLHFGFELKADSNGIEMAIKRWWFGPIPMPRFLAPTCIAREHQEGDRFFFEVPVEMPFLGLVVNYKGWLKPSVIKKE